MSSKDKVIINEAFVACMHDNATEEQELIWKLATAIHDVRIILSKDNMDKARKLLYENDYTCGTN